MATHAVAASTAIVVLKEVSLVPIAGEKLEFKNVPFLVDEGTPGGLTIGSTLLGQFAMIGMCTQAGARPGLHFSFELRG